MAKMKQENQSPASPAGSAAKRAHLSRVINRGIEIKEQIEALNQELSEVKNQIWDMTNATGMFRTNKGHVEIKQGQVLSVPQKAQGELNRILGDRYPDLVEEAISLKAKSGLRRLIFEPGPTEREISEALKAIVTIREQTSFSFKGAA